MSQLKSTVSLTVYRPSELSSARVDSLLKRCLKEEGVVQRRIVRDNLGVDCTEKTQYSSADSRKLVVNRPHFLKRPQQSRLKEASASEARRILASYQKRLKLAKWLKARKWEASYQEARGEFGFLKRALFDNVLRAKALPRVPKVHNPRWALSKVDSQLSEVALDRDNGKITLVLKSLWRETETLTFQIPAKLLELHSHLVKVSKPTIYLKDGTVTFDFTLFDPLVDEDKDNPLAPESVIGVDIGVTEPFVATRVYDDGSYGKTIKPSEFTKRDYDKFETLTREIEALYRKNKARESLGAPNLRAVEEEKRLRLKRARVRESRDWQVARDIVDYAEAEGSVIAFENLKWSKGRSYGSKRFTHSSIQSKTEHRSARRSKSKARVIKVNAAGTSQECPRCYSLETSYNENSRVLSCLDCGQENNKDVSASMVIGSRGFKVSKTELKRRRKRLASSKMPSKAKKAFYGSREGLKVLVKNKLPGVSCTGEHLPLPTGLKPASSESLKNSGTAKPLKHELLL